MLIISVKTLHHPLFPNGTWRNKTISTINYYKAYLVNFNFVVTIWPCTEWKWALITVK